MSEKKWDTFKEKLKKNPWISVSLVLAVVSVILIVISSNCSVTGKAISEKEASEVLIDYLNGIADDEVTLLSSEDTGNLYQVVIGYKGDEIPLYVTKDGKYYVPQLIPMVAASQPTQQTQQQAQQTEVPKNDKPIVEAFVFSYCPYGLQFQKALLPVYKALKDKADIRLVAIGAMHGEYEEKESLRQICIQDLYGKDKLWDYLEVFMGKTEIGDCRSNESCSKPYVDQIFTQLGINKKQVESCMSSDGQTLYQQDEARAQGLGISGSPTFVINNVKVQVSRSPAAILQVVCSAFNNAPAECSQTLSTEQASPWFGYSASSASSAASCG